MNKKLKIILISSISVLVAGAILVGALWYFGNSGNPVKVRPVAYCSTMYYEDEARFDGLVTADNLQSIYASDTQSVTEVFVTMGQQVKKGDKLLSYDTTLSEIQLERKQIAVQQAELDLENAKKDLERINAMIPYSPPPSTEPPTEAPTEPLTPVEELPYDMGGEGTQESPHRWLWSENGTFDDDFLQAALGEQNECWLSFEVREENAVNGSILQLWGLHVIRMIPEEGADPILRYHFFTPVLEEEQPVPPVEDDPWVDNSSGFSSSEIAQMRKEKTREIRDLDVALRLAKVELERMTKEAENGIILATVDGTVTLLEDAENAMMMGTPMMVVSGGGCFYVKVSIGEYDRQRFTKGTPVYIASWMSGGETVGVLESVSDLPTTGYYYGSGNMDVTLYEAIVSVDATAQLQEGEYVSVSFGSQAGASDTLYLENRYIRTENGQSYVYKRGQDGKLQKVIVTLGENLWGSYTAVYGDLTMEDFIAFPYGKDVRDGADTVEDTNMGYGYYYG